MVRLFHADYDDDHDADGPAVPADCNGFRPDADATVVRIAAKACACQLDSLCGQSIAGRASVRLDSQVFPGASSALDSWQWQHDDQLVYRYTYFL